MDPATYITIAFAVFFGLGFASAVVLNWQTRQEFYATLAERQKVIDDLRERVEADERARGLWLAVDTMAGKN